MQPIATKLARTIAAAPQGWSADDVRRLIHGVGGSPRRARRLLKSNPARAVVFRDTYAAATSAGLPHTSAVFAGNKLWLTCFPAAELAGEDESDDTCETRESTPQPVRSSLSALAAAIRVA